MNMTEKVLLDFNIEVEKAIVAIPHEVFFII